MEKIESNPVAKHLIPGTIAAIVPSARGGQQEAKLVDNDNLPAEREHPRRAYCEIHEDHDGQT